MSRKQQLIAPAVMPRWWIDIVLWSTIYLVNSVLKKKNSLTLPSCANVFEKNYQLCKKFIKKKLKRASISLLEFFFWNILQSYVFMTLFGIFFSDADSTLLTCVFVKCQKA